jgi:tetratricopeptide (TPR) repeat protein
MLRGMNALAAPGFLGRLSTALEDFIVLLKHPAFDEQSEELKVSIYYYAGVAHKRADDYDKARELFRKAISTLPDSDFAKRSKGELKDMGS